MLQTQKHEKEGRPLRNGVVQLAEVAGASVRRLVWLCLCVSRKPTVSNLCALERRPSFYPMATCGYAI